MTMQPRVPRRDNDGFEATCDSLRELAAAYAPTLLFNTAETLFPILAESWLSHVTYAPWPGDPSSRGLAAAAGHNEHHRGTALVGWTRDGTELSVDRMGGAPNPEGRPLQLTADPSDPDAIGRYTEAGPETALVVGGWHDPSARTAGDDDYLVRAYSEFGAAINPAAVRWDSAPDPDARTFWIHQPPTPTTYAEVSWTGTYPRLSDQHGHGDFAPAADGGAATELDGHLQVTYYYLFPARLGSTSHEGQWQAVTLFFRAERIGDARDEFGVPESLRAYEPPVAVALSQVVDGAEHESQVLRWDQVSTFQLSLEGRDDETIPSTSMLVYVATGTHAFYASPDDAPGGLGDGTYYPPGEGPGESAGTSGEDLGTDEFADEECWFFWVLIAILVVLIAIVVILAAVAAAVVAIIAAIVAAIIAIISLFLLEDYADDDGEEPHDREENEEATGDGPNAGPAPTTTDGTPGPPSDPPATGGHDDPSREGADVDAGQYVSGVGDLTGRDSAPFDVRVIDVLHRHEHSPFPPVPGRCELPAWWWYSGRWGTPMVPRGGWVSGKQRYDGAGRSWSYWHAADFEVSEHRE